MISFLPGELTTIDGGGGREFGAREFNIGYFT